MFHCQHNIFFEDMEHTGFTSSSIRMAHVYSNMSLYMLLVIVKVSSSSAWFTAFRKMIYILIFMNEMNCCVRVTHLAAKPLMGVLEN